MPYLIKQIKTKKELENLTRVWSNPPKKNSNFWRTFNSNKRLVLGAFDNKFPIGILTLVTIRPRKKIANGVDKAELNAFQVIYEKRGKGVGSMLYQKSIKLAKKEGFKTLTIGVETGNKKALSIYKHWGFKKFYTLVNKEGNEEIYLKKDL